MVRSAQIGGLSVITRKREVARRTTGQKLSRTAPVRRHRPPLLPASAMPLEDGDLPREDGRLSWKAAARMGDLELLELYFSEGLDVRTTP